MGTSVQPDPNTLQIAKKPQVPGQPGGTPPLSAASGIPAPTVAPPSQPVDRLALAQSNFNNFAQSSAPAYDASLRSATSQAAGAGQLGSGQLRTSLGDLSLARARDLDTQRTDLVNKATEGSIADASTAFQQGLAGAQQGLAGELGHGNLSIAQQQADTAKTGTLGSLGVQQGQLDLAKTGQATTAAQEAERIALAKTGQEATIGQSQQQIDLAKKTADINAQFQAGTLSLAQKDQALRELTAANQNTIATGQLELAKTGQEQQASEFGQSLAEQQASRLQAGSQFDKSLAQSGAQFKASLDQNAQQFGLSQDQTQKLAELQNATQNKQIDATTEQGKNQLLVALASLLGGPTGAANPAAMTAIAKQFGIVLPAVGTSSTDNPGVTKGKTGVDDPGIDPTKTGVK